MAKMTKGMTISNTQTEEPEAPGKRQYGDMLGQSADRLVWIGSPPWVKARVSVG